MQAGAVRLTMQSETNYSAPIVSFSRNPMDCHGPICSIGHHPTVPNLYLVPLHLVLPLIPLLLRWHWHFPLHLVVPLIALLLWPSLWRLCHFLLFPVHSHTECHMPHRAELVGRVSPSTSLFVSPVVSAFLRYLRVLHVLPLVSLPSWPCVGGVFEQFGFETVAWLCCFCSAGCGLNEPANCLV